MSIKEFFCFHSRQLTEIHVKEANVETLKTVDIARTCLNCGRTKYITKYDEPAKIIVWTSNAKRLALKYSIERI